jgi:integrase
MEEMREAWLRYLPLLRKRQGKFTCRPLTPATINLYLRWAKAAIGASLAPGETNPLTGIQQLPVVPRDRILDASERQKLLAAVEHRAPHLLPMIVFALRVPCRTGELLAMRREWVNLFTMTVDIPSGITKGGLPCSKPIPVELRDYFKGLRYDHVFTMPDGRPIRSFYGPWRNCLKDAGIVNWRLHDCRHQAVSAMAAEGISDRDIMGCAAWSTNMMQVYWHRDAKRSGAEIAARWTQNRTLAPYTSEADVVQMASG